MFDTVVADEALVVGASVDEDWFDPAWLDEVPPLEDGGQVPASRCVPSGWLALELDQGCADPGGLSDAELIEGIIGFDHLASWAGARQAVLLAQFARRRPGDHPLAVGCDQPSAASEFAPDEVGLALRLSRTAALNRLVMAQAVVEELPATLAAWQGGVIDSLKARAIIETSYLLPREQLGALEERVLPRAGEQTVARLRAGLARAVLALDPQGAQARHEQRRKDRRVGVSPDGEGMASLWALLSAPDATAAYQRLCELARGLGSEDPRGMDARRADLLIELLTGRRCAATGDPRGQDCPEDCDHPSRSDQGHVHPDQDDARQNPADQGPGKPLVSVIVPITMLLGLDDQPGELVGYGPIPAELARQIAADGTWRRLLCDPVSGTLLDHGRATYTPPAGLAEFVRARDVYCRHPICGQRAASADLDHTIAYHPDDPDGGTTSEHNLHASCRHHHRLKTHIEGWRVEQHSDDRVTWTTPTGHTYTSHPHDYRPEPPRPPPSDDPPPF
ncbi:MAG: HNH endonuclease [Actinomycetota bacterium]|nr:HNH endonuclease [Actinomycetota bacterium]